MFQVSSTIQSLRTLADGTIRLTVDCQELKPEESSELMKLVRKIGWFLFKENSITEQEIPNEPSAEFKGEKSPSQRLRSLLYVYWEKNTSKKQTFDDFYKAWVEKKANEIKELLD